MQNSLTVKIILNLFFVYISWGTLYYFNKNTIAVFGPFLTCGVRTFMGGAVIALFLLLRGSWLKPTKYDLLYACIMGFFMVTVGAGFLSKGQESVLSSTAALITASVPITMLVSGWLFAGEPCPSKRQWAGLVMGFAGLAVIAFSSDTAVTASVSDMGGSFEQVLGKYRVFVGIAWLFLATLGWIAGTLLTRRYPTWLYPGKDRLSALQSCALLLMFGGLQTFFLGLGIGEYENIQWKLVNAEILLSLAWLSFGGSVLAYSCYFWLLSHTSIAVTISYEYVVPVISMAVGYFLGNEPITLLTAGAGFMTAASVFFIIRQKTS